MPKIFDLLTEDHGKVKALLAKVQETGAGAGTTRDRLFVAQFRDASQRAHLADGLRKAGLK